MNSSQNEFNLSVFFFPLNVSNIIKGLPATLVTRLMANVLVADSSLCDLPAGVDEQIWNGEQLTHIGGGFRVYVSVLWNLLSGAAVELLFGMGPSGPFIHG